MPTDYITRTELRQEFASFELKILQALDDQRIQFERNVGAIAEHFLEKVTMLAEGVRMQIESVERLRFENSVDHERYEHRLSRLEAKRLFRKR